MRDLSALTQYAVVVFSSLFIVVDPLATAPLFVVMTEGDPPDKRRQMACRAACAAFLTLTGFALLGGVCLRLCSLTLSAFRIARGIILCGIALIYFRNSSALFASASRIVFVLAYIIASIPA